MFPPSPEVPRGDLRACAAAIRAGSYSFHAASRLLPASVRDPAIALYAFCRLADDAVDLALPAAESSGTTLSAGTGGAPSPLVGEGWGGGARIPPAVAVARLRRRLERIYAGRPEDRAPDRALAWVVERHALPRALPEALLEGLDWDARGRRYASLSELRSYAARVAGSVGAMMAVLMGARSAAQLARATDLGVAMQLTNIARDIGEDARAGRLYLPLGWLAEAGLDPADLHFDPRPSRALAALAARLLAEADRLYARADPGIARLPLACRPAIFAARHIYAAIGGEIARAGHDAVTRRARTSGRSKAAFAGLALVRSALPARRADAPPLPECAFLVEAAALPEPRRRPLERAEWLIDLFTELEKRDRMRQSSMSEA